MTRISIFTDGGSRGNPGPAGIGFSVVDTENDQEIASFNQAIGVATNNEAEYRAFLASAEWLEHQLSKTEAAVLNGTPSKVDWFLDSKLVVEQLNKNWKIKEPRMRDLAQKAWSVLDVLSVPYSISHVPRAQNKRADELVNIALDDAAA